MPEEPLGVKIARKRVAAGLTQAGLAAAIGATLRSVQTWEAGTTVPYERNLDALERTIGRLRPAVAAEDVEATIREELDAASPEVRAEVLRRLVRSVTEGSPDGGLPPHPFGPDNSDDTVRDGRST